MFSCKTGCVPFDKLKYLFFLQQYDQVQRLGAPTPHVFHPRCPLVVQPEIKGRRYVFFVDTAWNHLIQSVAILLELGTVSFKNARCAASFRHGGLGHVHALQVRTRFTFALF